VKKVTPQPVLTPHKGSIPVGMLTMAQRGRTTIAINQALYGQPQIPTSGWNRSGAR